MTIRLRTAKERKPSECTDVWCTKTSSDPSSGTIKPKPFLTSNHLTVPFKVAKKRMLVLLLLVTALRKSIDLEKMDESMMFKD
jgi:hypothetical protein